MKLLFLITVLVLIGTSADAEWIKTLENPDQIIYLDPQTVRRRGDVVKVWFLRDLKKEMTNVDGNGRSAWSIKALDEYECKEEQHRSLANYWYSGHMGSGDLLYSYTTPSNWVPNMPDTIGQSMWELVCTITDPQRKGQPPKER